MKKLVIVTSVVCALFAVSLQGAWNVVNTFNSESDLAAVTDVTNVVGSNARSEIVNGQWAVYPGDLFESTSNLYAMLDLGVDLKEASTTSGGAVTLYFEMTQPMVSDGQGGTRKAIVDTVWGLSNEQPADVLTTRYDSYNVMQRINSGTDGFEGRNGTSYEAVDTFTADVTYKIWIVVDFNLNFYEAYIQGGQWADQTKIDTVDMTGIWLFRVNPDPADVVDHFLIALSRGNSVDGEKGIDPTYFDNVAVDTEGMNLTEPVVSGWNVVSTFDDESALGKVTDLTNIAGTTASSSIENGMWCVDPGNLFEQTSNLYAMLDLGVDVRAASLGSGGPVTVYFEIMQPMVDDGQGGMRKAIVDTVWGLSNVPPAEVLTTRYDSYNVMQRINSGTDGFEGRNGTSYEAVDTFTAGVKYKIWIVVDYNLNFYEAYIQGGQWANQTKIDTVDMTGIWLFRVNPDPADVVDHFLVALSRGNSVDGEKGIDPTYFDTVAVDVSGMNLTDPIGEMGPGIFSDYPLVDDVFVNTMGWMGWLFVADYPWIYMYATANYGFVDEASSGELGAWVFIPNY